VAAKESDVSPQRSEYVARELVHEDLPPGGPLGTLLTLAFRQSTQKQVSKKMRPVVHCGSDDDENRAVVAYREDMLS
jgi:hypothetical protein